MNVNIVDEWGYSEALFGIGLSFGLTSHFKTVRDFEDERMKTKTPVFSRLEKVAANLAHKGYGESKFLESMCVSLDIDAPRYWWSEFDTYRVGMTKQSESTMHTITKRHVTKDDFEDGWLLPETYISYMNELVDRKEWKMVKQILPESFLQRRIVVTNYKTLQNMFKQRKNHRLVEWHTFCDALRSGLSHFEFIENYETRI